MLISHIYPLGLGNQMFCYSMGRAMSLRYNENYAIRIEPTISDDRPLGLDKFELWNFTNKVDGMTNIKNYIKEPKYNYNPNIYVPDSCFIGFWQSEKYFSDYSIVIKKDFQLKPEFISPRIINNLSFLGNINNSVGVHFRRGDYVDSTHLSTLPLSYYYDALDVLESKIGKFTIFIFSDDIKWTKKNFRYTKYPINYISEEDAILINKNAYEDLWLMKHCKHNIISNSTFAWWGAWLNENPEKIVISPRRWFYEDSRNNVDRRDITPQSWVVV